MEIGLAVAGAVASAVLPDIVSAFKAKFNEPLPCATKVEELQRELGCVMSIFEDYHKSSYGKETSSEQENLVGQLKKLAHEIEDVTERFLRHVISDGGVEKKKTSEKFGTDIEGLLDRAVKWIPKFEKACPKNIFGGSSCAVEAPDFDARMIFCDPPKGMDEPLEELKKLVASSSSELKVISIVGFGGLGKTLLASRVYEYHKCKKEDTQFDLMVWIRADGKDATQLLQEILQEVISQKGENDARGLEGTAVVQDKKGKDAPPELSLDKLGQSLKSELMNERYLIVIIDMRKKEQWSGVERAFSERGDERSRIIVTTTKLPVAKACSDSGGYVYKMRVLTDDYPRQIFVHSERGGSENHMPDDPTQNNLNKCGGLPLALACLSVTCKGEFAAEEKRTREALEEMCDPPSGNPVCAMTTSEGLRMRRMLVSSYLELPGSFVKLCLIYYCMFPADEDDTVRRNSVIRRLLAEGIADEKAADNLDTLVDHCVAQSTEVSNNGITKRCTVHGIVREFITRMSQDQAFVTVCDESHSQTDNRMEDARRLCLHPRLQWTLPVKQKHNKVRTLAVFGHKGEAVTTLSNKETIATYELMRVLDLKGCGGLNDSDLKNICGKLLLLKYLSIAGSITKVPMEIEKLQLLETLDLRKTKISEVPAHVIYLPLLKNLLGKFQLAEEHFTDKVRVFRKQDDLKHMFGSDKNVVRKELVKFLTPTGGSKLEMVSGFKVGTIIGFPQLLIHMANMRKVKIWCDKTSSEKNLKDLAQGIQKFLCRSFAENGRSLSIYMIDCLASKNKDLPEDVILHYLLEDQASLSSRDGKALASESIEDDSHKEASLSSQNRKAPAEADSHKEASLESFKLNGSLRRFPGFLKHLKTITELCLSGTTLSPEYLQAGLNTLPRGTLKYLKLVEEKFRTLMLSTEIFTSLVRICLVAEEITREMSISGGNLPSLVSLHLLCKKLDADSSSNIERFPALKEVGLHHDLDNTRKESWEKAAEKHSNWPSIVLIVPPKPKGA